MNTITAHQLVKRFDQKMAVDHVSFEVGEHEFLVVVGPSGCGKTTTLRMLVGLESVSEGEIRFGQRVVTNIRPRDRDVAMVFQDYAVFPHLNVFENIAYGLRARRVPTSIIDQRVPAAAKTFRIDHLLKRKPRQLSGGERQRVALARAMVRDATMYVYDEPLSNLDAQLRHQAREDILALHRRVQRPSIYVTHDQSEATALGDRIAVMRNGRIEQIGSGTDLYERPCNEFVAFFIGTPSINLFTVTLEAEDGGVYAACAAFRVRVPDALSDRAAAYIGRSVRFGIRPEDLHVPKMAPFPVSDENTIHGVINLIEPSATGSAVYLSTARGQAQDFVATFKVRLAATYIDKEIPLALNTHHVHLFDQDTERSLIYG
jgi:multiple sugar transport system ATP-binding protein